MNEEKKIPTDGKRHKWDSNRKNSHCKVCGCHRIKDFVITYELNGNRSNKSPNCK
jgi:hypothetical protein